MNIPDKLKVGGLTYSVQVVEQLDDDNAAAFTRFSDAIIKIEKNPDEHFLNQVFLHEVFHAINMEMPEKDVEFLAMSLYQVIVDNPTMFEGGEPKNG